MPKIRLQKYLSQCGVASRRAAEKMIDEGLVCINRRLATIGESIDPEKDLVTVKGKAVKPQSFHIYIALNKPRGYISSCSSSQGACLTDIVKIERKFFPVGRLDKESEGLILLTDDGELANRITHPRYGCEKEYEVTCAEELKAEELKEFRHGIMLEDGKTKPCKIRPAGENKYSIIISEGKKRQIRRMFQHFGKKVIRLKRTRIKGFRLGSLGTGQWRTLSGSEILELRS
ncbi:MAG: pseudouridine synthase [Candidatus Margulisiibacteriota bacterium]